MRILKSFRLLAFITVALLVLVTSGADCFAFDYILEGGGASRTGYETCNKSLPQFEKLLKKTFVEVIEKPRCVSDDSKSTFTPQFKVLANKPYVTRKIAGAAFSSLSFCQIELQKLISENSKNTPVLEGACIDQNSESLFKPEVVLLISEGI